MKLIILTAALLIHICLPAQNTGIGEQNPTAKLEVKSDGNNSKDHVILFRNISNQRLFHMNGLGASTFGDQNFSNPTHIIGVANILVPTAAHINLYSYGSSYTDPSGLNRIGFVNITGTSRKFEIQSYSGATLDKHSINFNYYNNNTTTGIIDSFSLFTLMGNGNVGIGIKDPISKLDVNGSLYVRGSIMGTFTGAVSGTIDNARVVGSGDVDDFLIKTGTGTGTRKGNGALGLNYIICIQGTSPTQGGATQTGPLMGEIKLFAGTFPPSGWMFCDGQLLVISQHTALFNVIGTTYGGDGKNVFALPDLKGAVPVHTGQPNPSDKWTLGERVY